MTSTGKNRGPQEFEEMRELAGEHAEDDRVIALMMRLATLGVDLSGAAPAMKEESESDTSSHKLNINERLKGQHEQVDGAVNKVVLLYKVMFGLFLSFYIFCLYKFIGFYLGDHRVAAEIPIPFRFGLGTFAGLTYFFSVIVARTHGKWNSNIEPIGLIAIFSFLAICVGSPDIAFPGFVAVFCFLYTLLRKDNRKRTIVVLTMLLVCLVGISIAAILSSIIFTALFASVSVGVLTAMLVRFVDTYRSGTVILGGDWLKTWKNYDDVRDELQTFDVLLESENKYAPSRITSLFSRSAWTHAAMIVREPSDRVRAAYGVETREELAARAREIRTQLVENPSVNGAQLFLELDRILDSMEESLYVFEAVRPVVALTPLKEWMTAKQIHMPYKVIVCRRFQEYQGEAKVQWNQEGFEDFMLEVNGLPFTLDANNMIRANYQLNTKKYDGSIFCSELVAEAFQRAGIFSKSRLSSNYTPNDFSSLVPTKFLLSSSLADEFWLREVDHEDESA